jgi:hypothetical protein
VIPYTEFYKHSGGTATSSTNYSRRGTSTDSTIYVIDSPWELTVTYTRVKDKINDLNDLMRKAEIKLLNKETIRERSVWLRKVRPLNQRGPISTRIVWKPIRG